MKYNTSHWIVTAHKRSLGQGNVFTRVCHSVQGGRRSLYDGTSYLADWSGPMFLPGGLSVQGVSVQGDLYQGDPQDRDPLGKVRGRYASYWNAYLFSNKFYDDYHVSSNKKMKI